MAHIYSLSLSHTLTFGQVREAVAKGEGARALVVAEAEKTEEQLAAQVGGV
jgi:hypothetical protein